MKPSIITRTRVAIGCCLQRIVRCLDEDIGSAIIALLTITCLALVGNMYQIKFRLSGLEKDQRQMRLLLQEQKEASTNHVGPFSVQVELQQPDALASLGVSVASTRKGQINAFVGAALEIVQSATAYDLTPNDKSSATAADKRHD